MATEDEEDAILRSLLGGNPDRPLPQWPPRPPEDPIATVLRSHLPRLPLATLRSVTERFARRPRSAVHLDPRAERAALEGSLERAARRMDPAMWRGLCTALRLAPPCTVASPPKRRSAPPPPRPTQVSRQQHDLGAAPPV